jgi:hypothetical protein
MSAVQFALFTQHIGNLGLVGSAVVAVIMVTLVGYGIYKTSKIK